MDNAARARLGDFIKAYGVSVCNTPTMCQIMLNQYCGQYPAEKEALTRALNGGAVSRLMAAKNGQPWDALAQPLITELTNGGMAEAEASWAVDAWGRALGKHPEGMPVAAEPTITAMSAPEGPPVDETVVAKAASYTLLVAGSGAAGGAIGAMAIMFAYVIIFSGATEGFAPKATGDVNKIGAVLVLINGVLGGLGGGLGGAAGWILGKGGGSRPWGAVKGCFSGALIAAAIGGRFCGIFGVFLGSFTASIGAALTGAYNS